MSPENSSLRRIRTSMGAAFLLLALLTGGALAATNRLHNDVARLESRQIGLFDDAWKIRYLDEALTHSTAQYALSHGDAKWRTRYDKLVVELDAVLAHVRKNAGPNALAPIEAVSSANDRLIHIEANVFSSTDDGGFAEAQAMLVGPYEEQKATYRKAVDRFFADQMTAINVALKHATNLTSVLRLASIIPGIILTVAVLLIGASQKKHAHLAAMYDDERNRTLEHQAMERRVSRALELVQTESDLLVATRDIFVAEYQSGHVEVLLADSSQTHLRQVATTDPTKQLPGCGVPSPQQCPAIRRGSTMSFDEPNEYHACPHLRSRELSGFKAGCVPVSLLGQTVGVVHAIQHAELDRAATENNRMLLERMATQIGDQVGIMRTLSMSELQASTDPLTGLLNRRSLEHRSSDFSLNGTPFSVVFFDLDHFKNLNDTFGHEIGDRALRVFSKTLRDSLRTQDLISRWGGEEFVVVLPNADSGLAQMLCERLREALVIALTTGTIPQFTMSAGIASSIGNETLLDVVARADEALLQSKRNGRNRVTHSISQSVT